MDVEKDFLHYVVRFAFVTKNSQSNASDQPGVAPEEKSESVTVTGTYIGQQGFVGFFHPCQALLD